MALAKNLEEQLLEQESRSNRANNAPSVNTNTICGFACALFALVATAVAHAATAATADRISSGASACVAIASRGAAAPRAPRLRCVRARAMHRYRAHSLCLHAFMHAAAYYGWHHFYR